MRVLFISNLFPDEKENYRGQDNANLLHRLSDHCSVRVLSTRPVRPFRRVPTYIPRLQDAPLRPLFVPYYYIPKVGSLFNHILFYYSTRGSIQNLIGDFSPDVILSSWSYPDSCAVAKIAKVCDIPLVSICQGSDVHMYMRFPLRSLVIRTNLTLAETVIPRSWKLGRILVGAGFSPTHVTPIYNGVDTSIFHPGDKLAAKMSLGLREGSRYLLYVGNFYTVKNPSLLVRAFAKAKETYSGSDLQLVMIGEGYLLPELEELARTLGVSEAVSFLGRKVPWEVAQFMRAADLLCIPSFNEGLPNVLLESLSCGLPVVSTDVGGISEVLDNVNCGVLVSSFCPVDFSQAILGRLQIEIDPSSIVDLSKEFSWDKTVLSYFRILQDAASIRH